MVEPGQPYVPNWHIDALCDHLEACFVSEAQAAGNKIDSRLVELWGGSELFRLLGNVPPGTMKSLLVGVFFPAWVWGPMDQQHKRFMAASHNVRNVVRDTLKCRRLIKSKWFQSRWPIAISSDQDTKTKFENEKTGFRQGVPFAGMTGERADFVILDDPMSVADALSDADREAANTTFRESLTTRLNNPEYSVIIVIMQRLHQDDTSGVILSAPDHMGYEHFMLPMRFDPDRRCETSIGFVDPREEEGELLFPARFPLDTVNRDEIALGPIATAGQMQQTPKPRGGQILKREYWEPWAEKKFPPFEFVFVSVDTAYTEKEENDPSACTVWGVWRDKVDRPRLMMIWGWMKHLELHGQMPFIERGESDEQFDKRAMPHWGLVQWIAYTARRFKADTLIIEAKATGLTAAQEVKRLYREERWQIILPSPTTDKIARAHEAEPSFAAGLVYAPCDEDGNSPAWCEKIIDQCENFPKSKFKDLVDSTTQAVTWARKTGLISHDHEIQAELMELARHKPLQKPLYDT